MGDAIVYRSHFQAIAEFLATRVISIKFFGSVLLTDRRCRETPILSLFDRVSDFPGSRPIFSDLDLPINAGGLPSVDRLRRECPLRRG